MKRWVGILGIACIGPVAQAAEDSRAPVQMPAMMQDHMRANMRDHLQTLNDILAALAVGRYEAAAEQAEKRLGMDSLAAHGADHMGPLMPPAMRETGTAMHHAASRFALAAQEAAVANDLPRALAALSEVTKQCTACHAGFRLESTSVPAAMPAGVPAGVPAAMPAAQGHSH